MASRISRTRREKSESLEYALRISAYMSVRYAIQLADTVKVGVEKAICFTDVVKKTSDVMLYFTDENEEKAPKKSAKANGGRYAWQGEPAATLKFMDPSTEIEASERIAREGRIEEEKERRTDGPSTSTPSGSSAV